MQRGEALGRAAQRCLARGVAGADRVEDALHTANAGKITRFRSRAAVLYNIYRYKRLFWPIFEEILVFREKSLRKICRFEKSRYLCIRI